MDDKTFAEQLKAARKATGLSQQGMADRMLISKRTIEKWEIGETGDGRTPPPYVQRFVLNELQAIAEEAKKHACYGERKAAKSEPIIDRATFEQFQENLKAHLAAKASTPSTAAKRPLLTITHRQTSEIPDMPPLGYKWQDGMLVKDEAEAELIKRGYREMTEHGQVSMETQREIRRALRAKIEAWRKKHQ
jgi:transcriptional regulator with XRE-family HTH domain